jgi:hypothetical protein
MLGDLARSSREGRKRGSNDGINPSFVQKFRSDLVDLEDQMSRGLAQGLPGNLGGNCCFGLTVELGGLIAPAMTNAATILIARRRRNVAVWADVCV